MRRRIYYQSPRRRKIESINQKLDQINTLILILEKSPSPDQVVKSRREQLIINRKKLEFELIQVKALK